MNGGASATAAHRRRAPVEALDRPVATLALVLLAALSLVLVTAPDRGVAGLLWRHREDLRFVWEWHLPSLATAVLVYLLADGGSSWRPPRADGGRLRALAGAWLLGVLVATFVLDIGRLEAETVTLVFGHVVAVVLAEELVFRGAVFGIAVRVCPVAVGIPFGLTVVLSAALFALRHLQYWDFDVQATWNARFYTPVMGLVLGVLRARSGSIWPSIALHGASNVLATLAGSL